MSDDLDATDPGVADDAAPAWLALDPREQLVAFGRDLALQDAPFEPDDREWELGLQSLTHRLRRLVQRLPLDATREEWDALRRHVQEAVAEHGEAMRRRRELVDRVRRTIADCRDRIDALRELPPGS